ncbi:uncharacterized [Tachysurus ichikawai]
MNAEYQLAHYCQEIKLFLHTVCMDGLIRLCTTARNRNFQGEKVELATASELSKGPIGIQTTELNYGVRLYSDSDTREAILTENPFFLSVPQYIMKLEAGAANQED